MVARQLAYKWENQYGISPVLLETFVDTERFTGACCKAANWIFVGKTKGRGKPGPTGEQSVPIKDIWLYPLCRKFKKQLTADSIADGLAECLRHEDGLCHHQRLRTYAYV